MRALVISLALFATAAHADDKPQNDLKKLVGNWTGKGTLKMGPKTLPVQATWQCSEAASGMGLRCRMSVTGVPGVDAYVVDDVWGHSQGDGLVHWYAVTTGGEVHDHKGHFQNGAGLLQYDGPMNGKTYSEVIRFKLDGNRLSLVSNVTLGGEPQETFTLDFTR